MDIKTAGADGSSRDSRLLRRREPGMELRAGRFPGKSTTFRRKAIDAAPGPDHCGDGILDFAAGLVLRPRPDAGPGRAAANEPVRRRIPEPDVRTRSPQPAGYRCPPPPRIVVRIHDLPTG